MKIFLWIVGIVLAIFIGLMIIGFNIQNKAQTFMTEAGFKDARTVGADDSIMCPGTRTGLVVEVSNDEGTKSYYPVCVSLFSDSAAGKFIGND
jgi:hypothetical protein